MKRKSLPDLEILKKYIAESKNFPQLFKKIGWARSGTAYSKLKKIISENNLDISHFIIVTTNVSQVGESNSQCKLNKEQREYLVRLIKEDYPHSFIAKKLNVTERYVNYMWKKQRWQSLDRDSIDFIEPDN